MMLKSSFVIILLTFFLIGKAFGQDRLEQKLITETQHVAQIFDFENSDFYFLDSLVSGKNIILLGEASHGHGKTFLLKKKLIEHLNLKHGFNHLVMEGGSMFALNEILKNDTIDEPSKILEYRRSIYGIWAFSKEFIPTLNYAIDADMKIIGMESGLTIMNNQYLLEALYTECMLQNDTNFTRFRNLFFGMIGMQFQLLNEGNNYEFFTNYLETMEMNLKESDLPSKELGILYNSIKSVKVSIDNGLLNTEDLDDVAKMNNSRDSMMFENFLIQYEEKEKYIIWLANFHAVKNIKQITYDGLSNNYKLQKLFGSYINQKFKNNSLALVTISDNGYKGTVQQEVADTIKSCLDCPIARSLNFDKNQSYFIPTSKYSKELREASLEFNSIIFGAPKIGNWINQVDGIFILSEMTRATLYDKPIHLKQ